MTMHCRKFTLMSIGLMVVFAGANCQAQTCKINDNDLPIAKGDVKQFGDLKLRLNDISHTYEQIDYNHRKTHTFLTVDIKAPGFEMRGVDLESGGEVRTFNICSTEVTLAAHTSYGFYIRVSTF